EVLCRDLKNEQAGLLKECAALRKQLEERDKIIERLTNEISNMSKNLSKLMENKSRKRGRQSISSSASSLGAGEDMFVEPPESDMDGSMKASSESAWRGPSRRQRKNRSRKMHRLLIENSSDQVRSTLVP
ncbi:unnamed protein product, partial [Callosobruchus maculatus]